MAPPTSCKMPLAFLVCLSLSLVFPSALADVICEDLPQDRCAFAVSSSSKRCMLESYQRVGLPTEYKCRTSEVGVDRISDHIETDQCVRDCGVDRNSVGISSDALLETQFHDKLCSPECFQNCPNIIDLYYNLAAGEGVFLPDLCQTRRSEPHRAMSELLSSGAAPGPVASTMTKFLSSDAAPGPVGSAVTELLSSGSAPGPLASAMTELLSPGAAPGPLASAEVSSKLDELLSSGGATSGPIASAMTDVLSSGATPDSVAGAITDLMGSGAKPSDQVASAMTDLLSSGAKPSDPVASAMTNILSSGAASDSVASAMTDLLGSGAASGDSVASAMTDLLGSDAAPADLAETAEDGN